MVGTLELNDILNRLEGVKGHGSQYSAKCPAHDDKKASLCVSCGSDGRVLLKCQAGCDTQAVVDAMGLKMSDLFVEKPKGRKEITATYPYKDESGKLLGEKIRYTDKSFLWRRPATNGWEYKKPANMVPYNLPAVLTADTVFIVEGEKDVDALTRCGITASCSPDGAGPGKWKDSYTTWFTGKSVCIIQDNDQVGKAFAQEEAVKLHKVATSVKVLDLTQIWESLPEHGDTSDIISHFGIKGGSSSIQSLTDITPKWEPAPPEADPFLSCFKTLDTFEEEEATWLIPGWMPDGQITLLAADGGIGKTTIWCNIISALSNGSRCVLDPIGHTREPAKVLFMTTEDSVRKKLKRKLRLAGANTHNILTPDFTGDKSGLLKNLKFGSDEMEKLIRHYKPALCVFDPVQGFIPPDINMGSRNAMRDCMAPLISLGEECGTAFLVVCHTNKRKGAYGRDRIADSADLWDISRSVLMAGYTDEQGVRYLSNEKNNYAQLQDSLLFTIDDNGQVQTEGTTWKRDREYMQEAFAAVQKPKRDDCKEFILNALDIAGGSIKTSDLESQAKAAGYSDRTVRRAKDDLKASGDIRYRNTGGSSEKIWYTERSSFTEMPADFPSPS